MYTLRPLLALPRGGNAWDYRAGPTDAACTASRPLARLALTTPLSHSRGMAEPIRDSANDNQLCRPSVGDSLRATAARADIGPRLAQMLRDAAALADVIERKFAASAAAQASIRCRS